MPWKQGQIQENVQESHPFVWEQREGFKKNEMSVDVWRWVGWSWLSMLCPWVAMNQSSSPHAMPCLSSGTKALLLMAHCLSKDTWSQGRQGSGYPKGGFPWMACSRKWRSPFLANVETYDFTGGQLPMGYSFHANHVTIFRATTAISANSVFHRAFPCCEVASSSIHPLVVLFPKSP